MPDVQTSATNQLSNLPFGNLIGGPLNAAVEAQAVAAKTSYEFIQGVGFDENGKTRNVTFTYSKGAESFSLTVPVLTIVPIPFIRIDSMDINFKAQITASTDSSSSTTESTSKDVSGSASVSYGFGPWKASVKMDASYSSKKDSTSTASSKYSVEYTMDVAVHAQQEDMPAGLAKVLGILQDSIEASSGTQKIESK